MRCLQDNRAPSSTGMFHMEHQKNLCWRAPGIIIIGSCGDGSPTRPGRARLGTATQGLPQCRPNEKSADRNCVRMFHMEHSVSTARAHSRGNTRVGTGLRPVQAEQSSAMRPRFGHSTSDYGSVRRQSQHWSVPRGTLSCHVLLSTKYDINSHLCGRNSIMKIFLATNKLYNPTYY